MDHVGDAIVRLNDELEHALRRKELRTHVERVAREPEISPLALLRRSMLTRWIVGMSVGIAALAYWHTGRMDHVLYPLGFNAHECGRNAFGAVFCGSELDQYRHNSDSVERQVRDTLDGLR